MINKITVSVIIPFKFQPEFLKEALSSLHNQKGIENITLEIIIVQEREAALDLKKELDKKFPNICYLLNEDKEGPGGSRQTGMKKATGEYILFLDADDTLDPLFFNKLLKKLLENPQASGILCLSKTKFEKGFRLKDKLKLYPLMFIRDTLRLIAFFFNNQNIFPSAFYLGHFSHMIFRTSLVNDIKFDYQYRRGGEDWDFFVKAMQKGPIKIVPHKLVYFRHSPGSSTYLAISLKNKWRAYFLLANNLPNSFKKGFLYKLFLFYIKSFGKQHV